MESIHDTATKFGIARPELEYQQYKDGEVTVITLTPESEQLWSEYLRTIGLARIALL